MSTKMKNLVLSFIYAIAFVGCGTKNDTPELPSNAKVDYYIDYQIDGKREKYIIDTGHLNTLPWLSYSAEALLHNKIIDGVNNQTVSTLPFAKEIPPFGKSLHTQSLFPCFTLTMSLFNFSTIQTGDNLQIDSFTENGPQSHAVGLVYYPKAGPMLDSIVEIFELGLIPIPVHTTFVNSKPPNPAKNRKILGKNGSISIESKKLIDLGPGKTFYILKGTITGDFMKYKVIEDSRGNKLRKNIGYYNGKINFQLPIYSL